MLHTLHHDVTWPQIMGWRNAQGGKKKKTGQNPNGGITALVSNLLVKISMGREFLRERESYL